MTLLPIVANANRYNVNIDGIYYNLYDINLNNHFAEVIKNPDLYTGNVVIPSRVAFGGEGYYVTDIDESAFRGCTGLTSVTIGSYVTIIGSGAFKGCTSLTTVTLSSNAIVSKAYSESYNLKSIFGDQVTQYVIGDIVTSIGNYAFYGCSGLPSITIPNSVTSIGDWAFLKCSGLTSISLPESVTSIGEGVFGECGLTSVYIPNSVTSIGERTFCGCVSLSSISIPNSVTTIGIGTFLGCTSLNSIEIPNSVTSIGACAFQDCSSLTSIKIPNNVTSIRSSLFQNCSGLTSITIPNSVTSIDYGAFQNCSSLATITIPNSVTFIDRCAFQNCSSLSSITIQNGVSTIDNFAFSGCSSLTTITIPNSVTIIGAYAFKDCSKLTTIAIPNSVTIIGISAFSGCIGLTSIEIPNSITVIESDLFKGCTSLSSVLFPQGVTRIENNAFLKCTSLTSIVIPSSVTFIGSQTFYGCDLSSVTTLSITPPEIYSSTFDNNTYNNATLYIPRDGISNYYSNGNWSKFTNIELFDNGESYIEIDTNNFPDDNFRAYLLNQTYGEDGVITNSEINEITHIDVANSNITSLQGLKHFIFLKTLDCHNNMITSLDVSMNTDLEEIYCYGNHMDGTGMDVLIEGLSDKAGGIKRLYVIANLADYQERNVCTTKHVEIAKTKGWTVLWKEKEGDWQEYIGSEPTEIGKDEIEVYSWESPNGTVKEVGGKASSYSPDETNRVNYKNGDYWTLCLNGKWRDLGSGSDGSGYIMIQFDKDIKAGDIIHLTGYINNHNDSKEASIYFHRGFSTEGFADDYIFDVKDNIGNGGKVTTHSFVIPENMGDNILMTRKKAETNIYLVKVCITRPVSNIVINEANFPDANFRDYLSNMPFGKDGVITESEIKDIKELDIVARNISDLQGIEFFTALKRLNCNGNKISSLDVSKNMELAELQCDGNQLTSLDVSNNTALKSLFCHKNQITNLDLSNNRVLEFLYCMDNQLTSLDVSNNLALIVLNCNNNQLTKLDLSSNKAMELLYCYKNQLTSLEVSKEAPLQLIDCARNQLNIEAMDIFVESLPHQDGAKLYFKYSDGEYDGNTCTPEQVNIGKEKGWQFLWCKGNWEEYTGESTDIDIITIDKESIVDVYTLEGQHVNSIRKGLNLVKMKDGTIHKIMVK